MNAKSALLLVAIGLPSVCSAQASNLIVNGGFESPSVSFPWQNFAVGSSAITGWTVIADTASVLNSNCCLPASPYEGSQYLDLTGPNDSQRRYGGVAQVVATSIGQVYELSFQQGNYFNNTPSFDAGSTGILAVAGGTSENFTVGAVASGSVWVRQSLTFVATSSLTTIALTGTAGNLYVGLDDVTVSAVPEPATWLQLSLGIAGLGLLRLRKPTVLG
jgi:Protein of unknown function (DUF642)